MTMDRRAAIGRALRAREGTPNPAFVSLTDDEQTNGLALFGAEEAGAPERHQTFERVSSKVVTAAPTDRAVTHARPPALPEPGNVLVWQVPALAAMFVAVVAVFALISATASKDAPVERAAAAAHDVVLAADAPMPALPMPIQPPAPSDEPSGPDHVTQAVAIEAPRVRTDPPVRTVAFSRPRPVEPRPTPAPALATIVDGPAALPASLAGEPRPAVAVPAAVAAAVPPAPPRADAIRPPVRPPAPESAVQTALSRYRNAYGDLDAGAARAVWPTVDHKALSRAFDRLEQQQLIFDSCEISVTDARAVASCRGVASYVPRVGNKDRRDDRREWEFRLSRVDDAWLIDTVSAR